MIKFKLLAAVLFSGLFILSCDPNDDVIQNTENNEFLENFGSRVNRDFIGQVVDVQNNPIENATVTIGSSTIETDKNGVFLINDAFVFEKFAHIKATKPGYIDGSHSMVPTHGKNRVTIMMLSSSDNSIQNIESGVRTEVSMHNGTKIVFDGAFQDGAGRAYSGTVQVVAFHLLASDDNLSSLMPGMLYAEDKNGEEKVLETYGMLNVELYGNNGQKLQIAAGHTAEISLRIDDEQLTSAPNTIPLSHFDEKKGYWKEEGLATREGNVYVGKVSHFSWWNWDVQFVSITLSVKFIDNSGNPIPNLRVQMFRDINNNIGGGITDDNGNINGNVPVNETLTVKIYDDCLNEIYSSVIGPFTSDTVLQDIMINNSQTTSVTGHLLKCNNTNVTNGYVYFKSSNKSIFVPVTNGIFTVNITNCASINSFFVQGFDLENNQETGNSNYNTTGSTTDIGNLTACTSINEYVTFTIDNNPSIQYTESYMMFVRRNTNDTGYNLQVDPTMAGLFRIKIHANTKILGIYSSPPYTLSGLDIPGTNINSQMPNTLSFNLTSFGNIGEFVDLSVDGSFYDTSGIQHTIHLTAHVIRVS